MGQWLCLTSSQSTLYKYGLSSGQETVMFDWHFAVSRATRETTTSYKTGTTMPARRGG